MYPMQPYTYAEDSLSSADWKSATHVQNHALTKGCAGTLLVNYLQPPRNHMKTLEKFFDPSAGNCPLRSASAVAAHNTMGVMTNGAL